MRICAGSADTLSRPLLGGALSTPADKYAWLDVAFLRRYPYFLPGGVSSVVTLIAVITGYFLLREVRLTPTNPIRLRFSRAQTLPSKVRAAKKRADKDRSGSATPVDVAGEADDAESDKPLGMRALLADPAMRALVTSNAGLSFLCTGYEVVFVLYAYTAVPLGGLGFPARQIGYALSVSGLVSVGGQLVLMPWLLRTFDAARMYNLCFWMFPFIFPLMSALNLIARAGYDEVRAPSLFLWERGLHSGIGDRDAEPRGGRGDLGGDRGHAADVALRSSRVRVSPASSPACLYLRVLTIGCAQPEHDSDQAALPERELGRHGVRPRVVRAVPRARAQPHRHEVRLPLPSSFLMADEWKQLDIRARAGVQHPGWIRVGAGDGVNRARRGAAELVRGARDAVGRLALGRRSGAACTVEFGASARWAVSRPGCLMHTGLAQYIGFFACFPMTLEAALNDLHSIFVDAL